MRNEETDLALLYDIYEAARDITKFVQGVDLNAFAKQKVLRLAVERQLEVIGEAIKRLTEKTWNAHPEIPWQQIVSQRNIIAHEYDKLQMDKIYRVATDSIPKLLAQIEPLIPPEHRLND